MSRDSGGGGRSEPGIVVRRGRAVGGFAIGVLVIDAAHPLVPGNVANASTFRYPVLYEVLNISVEEILRPGPELCARVVEGARALERRGVRAIVGACGTLAAYQRELAAAVNVPVFASILTQVPFILQSLGPSRTLGILASVPGLLTDRVREQCGITDESRLVIIAARDVPEFGRLLRGEERFDHRRLERELLTHLDLVHARHPELGALLIQCSDLPPYAAAIQARLGLPVFDMPALMDWLYRSLTHRPYRGLA